MLCRYSPIFPCFIVIAWTAHGPMQRQSIHYCLVKHWNGIPNTPNLQISGPLLLRPIMAPSVRLYSSSSRPLGGRPEHALPCHNRQPFTTSDSSLPILRRANYDLLSCPYNASFHHSSISNQILPFTFRGLICRQHSKLLHALPHISSVHQDVLYLTLINITSITSKPPAAEADSTIRCFDRRLLQLSLCFRPLIHKAVLFPAKHLQATIVTQLLHKHIRC